MKKVIQIAPRNSVILVMDQSVGEVPNAMDNALVAATPSCIAVGTLSEHDGETLISLSDGAPPNDSGMSLVFNGVLATPMRKLAVCSVLDEELIVLDVSAESTQVKVWANDEREPDKIHVVVEDKKGKGGLNGI